MDTGLDERRLRKRSEVAGEIRSLMGRGRNGRRVTQRELAAYLGMSDASLSDRLRCKTPFDIDELDRVAEFFGEPSTLALGTTTSRYARVVADLLELEDHALEPTAA